MGAYSINSRRRDRREVPPPALPQAFVALAGGLGLFILALCLLVLFFDARYMDHIYPGVSVAGVSVAGLPRAQAAAEIARQVAYPQNGKIVFKDGNRVWAAKPADLGLYLDPENTALAAYSLGRTGDPISRQFAKFGAWYSGQDLPPLLVYDERAAQAYLEKVAAQVNVPTVEASLAVSGTNVVVKNGQTGRYLNVAATLAPLESQMRGLSDGVVPLVIEEKAPLITDVSAEAESIRKLLAAPLTLQLPDAQKGDPGPWTIKPAQLAKMLTIERVDAPATAAGYQVGLNPDALTTFIKAIGPAVSRAPADGRYTFNEKTSQLEVIQPAVVGRSLDVDGSVRTVFEKLKAGEHTIPLSMTVANPKLGNDASAEKLGIRELVSSQTTYFYGSSAERIQNIVTAASRFQGVMVAPGATFSMASVMGDVSLDTGYAEALIIYGNRTIKGVGGGVCQVSTTLFRTVFFGGFPVVERYPHAYRVLYYEQNAAAHDNPDMAGLDATVFVPQVDFKFKNDTPYWLLMETYTNVAARTLTWKFYSTSDGRKVDWKTSGLQNVTPPDDPQYEENPDLGKGEIKQIEWAVDGADVLVNRTVTKDGQVYFQDKFATHYVPWPAAFQYGPGTKLPDQPVKH